MIKKFLLGILLGALTAYFKLYFIVDEKRKEIIKEKMKKLVNLYFIAI